MIVTAEQASVQHLPRASPAEGLPQQHAGSGGRGGRVIPTWGIGGVAAVLPPKVAFACGQPILHTWSSQIDTANLLSDKNLEDWQWHTLFINKAGKILSYGKKSMKAELSAQARCKFHDILHSLLPDEAFHDRELDSFHLCETPGAFIASLNHSLKSHHVPRHWNWIANALIPYHEASDTLRMVMDHSLIANILPWITMTKFMANIVPKHCQCSIKYKQV
uniref:Uncharacterized protein n=1 Tax=Serinus canaria TaxID=9135 RepID=A0A8C9NCP9_SERCA